MDIGKTRIVVAKQGPDGKPVFEDIERVWQYNEPGIVQAAFYWELAEQPALPAVIGNVPPDMSFPPAGASKMGLVSWPPRSSGKLDVTGALDGNVVVDNDNPALHRSDTVDVEVIISGKINLVLEGGKTRTLMAGTCVVMGGVMHAWENPYDEPCVFAIFLTGAQPAGS